jgi:hypothetical protein
MSLLEKIKRRMDDLNVPYQKVELSNLKEKKIKVVINNRIIHFGNKNSHTFIEGASEKVRDAYRARHSRIMLANGRRAIDVKYSPAWLSWFLLWS